MNYSEIRADILNRDVAVGFGVVAAFFIFFLIQVMLEIDPYANLLFRVLIIPGYAIWLGFTVLRINLFPGAGPVAHLAVLGIYLASLSLLLGWLIRAIRQAVR